MREELFKEVEAELHGAAAVVAEVDNEARFARRRGGGEEEPDGVLELSRVSGEEAGAAEDGDGGRGVRGRVKEVARYAIIRGLLDGVRVVICRRERLRRERRRGRCYYRYRYG